MLDSLKVHYLIGSFCVGIFFVYISAPQKKLVKKFPGPHNSGDVIFTDQNDACYTYDAEVVPCNDEAIPQPILEDFAQKTKK